MADESPQEPDAFEEMEISREAKPEVKVHFDRIEELCVEDEEGLLYRFGDLYKDRKTIIILIRHFLCFMTKEYVDDLSLVPNTYLKEADVDLIVIGCGPSKFIKPFRQATGYKGKFFTDESREIYKQLGCSNEVRPGKIKDSKHVKSTPTIGWLKAFMRGLKYAEFQGDVMQQGASLIVGPGSVLHHAHIDQESTDHCPINDLLTLAGCHPVNFPKDSRVITL